MESKNNLKFDMNVSIISNGATITAHELLLKN